MIYIWMVTCFSAKLGIKPKVYSKRYGNVSQQTPAMSEEAYTRASLLSYRLSQVDFILHCLIVSWPSVLKTRHRKYIRIVSNFVIVCNAKWDSLSGTPSTRISPNKIVHEATHISGQHTVLISKKEDRSLCELETCYFRATWRSPRDNWWYK